MGKGLSEAIQNSKFDAGQRAEIAEAITELSGANVQSVDDLYAVATEADRTDVERETACWLIGRLGTPGIGTETLTNVLRLDTSPRVRIAAATAVAEVGEHSARTPLTEALQQDPEESVRAAAAHSLGVLGDEQATEALIATLRTIREAVTVRAHAAEALGHLLDRSDRTSELAKAVATLRITVRDPSAEVRFWSIFAIGELGGRDVIPLLRSIAESDSSTLPQWGPVADEARAAIRRILQNG